MNRRFPALMLMAAFAGSCAPEQEPIGMAAQAICADGPTLEFVDVSYAQGTINWDALRADSRVAGAIIRVSNGTRIDDTQIARNWSEAHRVGMPRGAYHFYEHCQDPNAQADHFLAVLAAAGGSAPDDLPPMLDWEWSDMEAQCATTPYPPAGSYVANIQTFLDRLEAATGKTPLIYTNVSFLETIHVSSGVSLGGGRRATILPDSFARYPLIVAAYTSDCTRVEIPAPWMRWTAWQYTSTAMRNGISTHVDIDQFNGDMAAFGALYMPPAVVPTSPLPPPAGSCDFVACNSDGDCGANESCVTFSGISTASGACTIRVCGSSSTSLRYVPLDTPVRALDAMVGAGATSVPLPSVPAGAQGVVANLAMVSDGPAAAVGYVGSVAPQSVELTTYAGAPRAALAIAPIRGSAFTAQVSGSGRLLVDVSGYLVPDSGLYFHPTPVRRVLDTRDTGTPFTLGETRRVPLGLPPGSVAALNITAVGPTLGGFLTVFAEGALPGVSSVNYGAGENIGNRVFARVGSDGGVAVFSNSGGLHLIVDMAGSFDADPTNGFTFRTHDPVRLIDSREGRGLSGTLGAGATTTLAFPLPAGSAGGYFSLTAIDGPGDAFLQLFASSTRPDVSDLNVSGGRVVSGGLPLVTRADHSSDLFNNAALGLVTEVDALLYPTVIIPPPMDAGTVVPDAGVVMNDAGTDVPMVVGSDVVTVDAIDVVSDTTRADAGHDGSVLLSDGSRVEGLGELHGRCSCRIAGAAHLQGRNGSYALLLALGVVAGRRRRMRVRSHIDSQ